MSTPAKKVQVLGKFMNGLSAYDLAVKNGFEGTEEEWLASLSEAGASVKYVDQTLTDEQKVQARENIDVPSNGEIAQIVQQVTEAFGYTVQNVEQTLTDEQKAQARTNIGAMSQEEAGQVVQSLMPYFLPEVTAADDGKFLQVVGDKWSKVSLGTAEEASF